MQVLAFFRSLRGRDGAIVTERLDWIGSPLAESGLGERVLEGEEISRENSCQHCVADAGVHNRGPEAVSTEDGRLQPALFLDASASLLQAEPFGSRIVTRLMHASGEFAADFSGTAQFEKLRHHPQETERDMAHQRHASRKPRKSVQHIVEPAEQDQLEEAIGVEAQEPVEATCR